MNIVDSILEKLDSKGISYHKYEHEPVVTSEEAAAIRNTDISIGIKALIFIADGAPVLLAVTGNKRIDTKKFKNTYGVKDLRMADSKELKDITGLEKGAVPPIGSLFKIPSYFDDNISCLDKAAFNAGSREISVELAASDLIDVENPIQGNFSKDVS